EGTYLLGESKQGSNLFVCQCYTELFKIIYDNDDEKFAFQESRDWKNILWLLSAYSIDKKEKIFHGTIMLHNELNKSDT
ncbi:19293_t:CDS:1, partial [Funneliformis geosporum]